MLELFQSFAQITIFRTLYTTIFRSFSRRFSCHSGRLVAHSRNHLINPGCVMSDKRLKMRKTADTIWSERVYDNLKQNLNITRLLKVDDKKIDRVTCQRRLCAPKKKTSGNFWYCQGITIVHYIEKNKANRIKTRMKSFSSLPCASSFV